MWLNMCYNNYGGGIMALFNLATVRVKQKSLPKSIETLIKRRRLQLIVHSCLYYRFNVNLISDFQYDNWAKELAKLHSEYGVIKINCYDSYFNDWIFDFGKTYTGFKLPINNNEIIAICESLLKYGAK